LPSLTPVWTCVHNKNAGDPRPVTRGNVRIFALDNRDFPAEATCGTWALNFKSRTLRAEIDLPNQGANLLPGMYSYGTVRIERPNVMALPAQAILEIGNQLGCYLVQDGKAIRRRAGQDRCHLPTQSGRVLSDGAALA
jgi:hypothetical protein